LFGRPRVPSTLPLEFEKAPTDRFLDRVFGISMVIDRTCPVCMKSSNLLFAEARLDKSRLDSFAYASRKDPEYMHHRLLLCDDCDLIYASPVPDQAELESEYEVAAFDSQRESEFAAATYAEALSPIIGRLPDRTSALDIGAGDGAFCSQLLRMGFENVLGLEPSLAPIEAAAPHVRHCLRQEMFTPGLLPASHFSLVCCFQTIEHVLSPLELCKEAARILRPGGVLCIVAHNRRAVSCRILGRRSPIFDVEHLQLFSPVSILQLFSQAGLQSIQTRTLWNTYPLSYWTRLFPLPGRIKSSLIWALNVSRIGNIPISLPAGNLVAWGSRGVSE
jgi:SAM-dependent methyltransferase